MENYNKKNEFARGGAYEGGLRSLIKTLQMVFLILVVVILIMLIRFITFGGYFAVQPQESVIVLQFGRVKEVFDKDWHWFLPYPVNRFVHVKTSPQFLPVNFNAAPSLQIPGAPIPPLAPGRDRYLVTGDGNILHSSWTISYRVSEPLKFYQTCLTSQTNPAGEDEVVMEDQVVLGARGPQTLLRNLFTETAIMVTAGYKVSEIYDTGRSAYAAEIERLFATKVQEAGLGLVVEGVALDTVTPPAETAGAFNEVSVALNRKAALKNQAEEYAVTSKNQATSVAAGILADARAYRTQVVAEVKAESNYFERIQKEYLSSPDTVLMALYNNTLADVLTQQDGKYILGTTGSNKQLRLKLNPEGPKRAKPQATEAQK